MAFSAVAGRINYVGDFIYSEDKAVLLRRDSPVAEQELPRLFPALKAKFSLSEAVPVQRPKMFLCMP